MIDLHVKLLAGFKDKAWGLINYDKAHAVMFKTRFGIHTFGVRFPIDVLILDKRKKVIKLAKRLPINSVLFWLPVYDTVIELPAGETEKMKISVGDQLNLIIEN